MPIGSGSEGLLYLPCEQMTQPEAIAAALVLMQAAQLLPGQTRNVAEPTAGPTAAAVSCMHHMQAGADDVTRLAIDCLAASAHANRQWQRRATGSVLVGAMRRAKACCTCRASK